MDTETIILWIVLLIEFALLIVYLLVDREKRL